MKITDVKCMHVDLGTGPRPRSDGGLYGLRWTFGFVEVYTDEGLTGFCPSGGTPSIIEGPLKEMLVGENPVAVERLWKKMFQDWRHPKLDEVMAIGKVDIALWDLVGKITNQPVWRLLGGANNRVRVYGAGGMYVPGKGIQELVDEMVGFVNAGWGAVKMKVGRLTVREDVARVKAVRDAIGPDVDLMIDINHAMSPSEAILFGRQVEEFRPYWIEEPVDPWDYKGCAEVARALDVPVATGENISTRYTFRDLIDARGADIIQADAYICGGITEWHRIAAYAAANNLPMAPHGNPHIGSHCVAGVPNGLIVEAGMYMGIKPEIPLIIEPLVPDQGYLNMAEDPGFGFKVDREAIEFVRQKYA